MKGNTGLCRAVPDLSGGWTVWDGVRVGQVLTIPDGQLLEGLSRATAESLAQLFNLYYQAEAIQC